MVDYTCTVVFPLMFATFNIIYWSLQFDRLNSESKELDGSIDL